MAAIQHHTRTEVGRAVAVAALLAGVEMGELYRAIGVSRESFRLRRIGLRRWQPGELEKIADRLGVTVEFLEGGAG